MGHLFGISKLLILAAAALAAAPLYVLAGGGDPAFYVGFEEDSLEVTPGKSYFWEMGPCNFGFVTDACDSAGYFCVRIFDTRGWVVTGDPPLEECTRLDPGYFYWQEVCVTVPCDARAGDVDTVIAVMGYCDTIAGCGFPEGECEDPNWYAGAPFYSADTIVLGAVESPPSIAILQDTLYLVGTGQYAAYVPFSICNPDPCAEPAVYEYEISSTGHVGDGFPQGDSTGPVPGGSCEDVYAVVDAGNAGVGDMDTLTIVAWDAAEGMVYDTCVQVIFVYELISVPVMSMRALTILVLALIFAGAVLMRRRAFLRGRG